MSDKSSKATMETEWGKANLLGVNPTVGFVIAHS